MLTIFQISITNIFHKRNDSLVRNPRPSNIPPSSKRTRLCPSLESPSSKSSVLARSHTLLHSTSHNGVSPNPTRRRRMTHKLLNVVFNLQLRVKYAYLVYRFLV